MVDTLVRKLVKNKSFLSPTVRKFYALYIITGVLDLLTLPLPCRAYPSSQATHGIGTSNEGNIAVPEWIVPFQTTEHITVCSMQ